MEWSQADDPRSKKDCKPIDPVSPKDMKAFQTIKVVAPPEGPTKRGLKRWWKVVLLVGVPILALGGVTLIMARRWPQPSNPGPSAIVNSQPRVSHTPQAALLELQGFRIYRSNGSARIVGEVKNISDKPLEDVTALGIFYDVHGTFVRSDTALIAYRQLLPGQTSPFGVLASRDPAMVNGEVEFIHYSSRELIPTQIISGLANAPRGWLDSPSPNATGSGPVLVGGWAIDQATPSGSLTLTLLIDGAPVSVTFTRGLRPDVCAVFSESSFPSACQSGFSAIWDSTGLTGTHTVAVRVTNRAGRSMILGMVPVTLP